MKTKIGEVYFIKQRYFQKYSDTFPDASTPFPGVYANKNKNAVAFTEPDADPNLSYRPYLKVFVDGDYPEIGFYVPFSTADMEYRKNKISMDLYRFGKCTTFELVEDNFNYQSISLNRHTIAVRDNDIYSEATYRGVKKTFSSTMVQCVREDVLDLINQTLKGNKAAFVTQPFSIVNELVRDINLEKQKAKEAAKLTKLDDKISLSTSEEKYTVDRATSGEQSSSKLEKDDSEEKTAPKTEIR